MVRLPSGKVVCELETYRETLPNGATYLVIDHMRQLLPIELHSAG